MNELQKVLRLCIGLYCMFFYQFLHNPVQVVNENGVTSYKLICDDKKEFLFEEVNSPGQGKFLRMKTGQEGDQVLQLGDERFFLKSNPDIDKGILKKQTSSVSVLINQPGWSLNNLGVTGKKEYTFVNATADDFFKLGLVDEIEGLPSLSWANPVDEPDVTHLPVLEKTKILKKRSDIRMLEDFLKNDQVNFQNIKTVIEAMKTDLTVDELKKIVTSHFPKGEALLPDEKKKMESLCAEIEKLSVVNSDTATQSRAALKKVAKVLTEKRYPILVGTLLFCFLYSLYKVCTVSNSKEFVDEAESGDPLFTTELAQEDAATQVD